MNGKGKALSPAGAEIVGALDDLLDALRKGDEISKRFTVRTYEFTLEPRVYTAKDLKKARELLNLSQALFAEFIGVSVKGVRAWEAGIRKLPPYVCRFLDEMFDSPDHWKNRVCQLIVKKVQHTAGDGGVWSR